MRYRKNILVAEDEAMVAFDLEMALREKGAHVVGPFRTLKSCLARAETEHIDGAILDVDLQGEDVFPVAEELQKNNVPFVFYTAHANSGELRKRFPEALIVGKPTRAKFLLVVLQGLTGALAE